MRTFSIATGSLSDNEANLFTGILPKRSLFGFVIFKAFEEAYNLNPFKFEHKNS